MDVWRDKCLRGSLRVARNGELARKIADIVADDQDSEPENVVHTHLCILLAEGDDLDLKRPRIANSTPRSALLNSGGSGAGGGPGEEDSNNAYFPSPASNGNAAMVVPSRAIIEHTDVLTPAVGLQQFHIAGGVRGHSGRGGPGSIEGGRTASSRGSTQGGMSYEVRGGFR